METDKKQPDGGAMKTLSRTDEFSKSSSHKAGRCALRVCVGTGIYVLGAVLGLPIDPEAVIDAIC